MEGLELAPRPPHDWDGGAIDRGPLPGGVVAFAGAGSLDTDVTSGCIGEPAQHDRVQHNTGRHVTARTRRDVTGEVEPGSVVSRRCRERAVLRGRHGEGNDDSRLVRPAPRLSP